MSKRSIVGENDDDSLPSPAATIGHGVANDVHKAEGVLQRVVDWERNFRGSLTLWVGGTGDTASNTGC